MHTRIVTLLFRLILACGILLALPGSAMAAPFSFTGPASVGEAAGNATYTVSCGTTTLPVIGEVPNVGTLVVAVSDGPAPAATNGEDYGPSGSVPTAFTCPPAGGTIDVPILNDTVDEGNEQFSVRISGALVANLMPVPIDQTVVTTITDDDPVASITPIVRVLEGDAGTSAAELTVTLASPAAQATTIGYSTNASSALAGSDFTATSGNVVIGVGQTTGTISVPIVGDTTPELAEVFFVKLGTTDNGSLSTTQNQGMVVIFDNEKSPLPFVSLPKTTSANENDGKVTFNVTLSAAATQRTEVSWKTVDWTAKKPSDYTGTSGKVVFGQGDKTKTISVNLKNDSRDEPDEALGVVLEKPVAANLGQRGGFGLIADDDGPKMKIGKPKVRGKRLVAAVTCPETADSCKGKLVAKAGKLKLGRKSFALAKGQKKTLRLKMSRKARKELAEHALRAKLKATASDGSGDRRTTTRKARLKRRR